MATSENSKTVILRASWKHYAHYYLLSALAVPLFGIGLIALYLLRKKQKERLYKVTDTQISSIDSEYRRNIDLVNIENIDIQQSWIYKKMNTGTLILHTSASHMKVIGMENPHKLKQILQRAIEGERKRQREREKTEPREADYDPGSMERMNYLTGLWQQGLISEEEFEKEKEHFE